MKRLLPLLAIIFLTGITVSATISTNSLDNKPSIYISDYGNSFIFAEQGVEFAVFHDGQFDFNLNSYRPHFSTHTNFGGLNNDRYRQNKLHRRAYNINKNSRKIASSKSYHDGGGRKNYRNRVRKASEPRTRITRTRRIANSNTIAKSKNIKTRTINRRSNISKTRIRNSKLRVANKPKAIRSTNKRNSNSRLSKRGI